MTPYRHLTSTHVLYQSSLAELVWWKFTEATVVRCINPSSREEASYILFSILRTYVRSHVMNIISAY
jgi:hypothetical protein